MTFKPGQSGNPAGRVKRHLKRPDEVLAEMQLHPVLELLKLIPKLTEPMQAKMWVELLPYVAAKRKEEIVEPDEISKLSNQELVQMVKEKIPDLEKVA